MREIASLEQLKLIASQQRLLLMFAPTEIAGPAAVQAELLGADPGCLVERSIEFVYVAHSDQAKELRDLYDVAEGSFAVLLVGRDRKVHLRSAQPVPAAQLCQMIDNMMVEDPAV